MALEFKYEEIKEKELKFKRPYAGYFTPNGDLIDYVTELGGSTHNSWTNPVSLLYLKYISYIITGETKDGKYAKYLEEYNKEKLDEMKYEGLDELVFRGANSYYSGKISPFNEFYQELLTNLNRCEERIKKNESFSYDHFSRDLLKFFSLAYKNDNYIKTTGKLTRVDNQDDLENKIKEEYNFKDSDKYYINRYLERKVNKELLSGFKDTCVQYMGYDSLERYGPKGDILVIPKTSEEYDSFFYNNRRVITSSYNDVYERYFNYLLMDWEIYKVPRFIYNEKTEMFEKEEYSFNSYREEKEEEEKEEIKSIKKLVPPHERHKYFIR